MPPPPFQEGDTLRVSIERMAYGGKGICKPHGFTLFVPRSAPGDEMEVVVQELRKRYGQAHPKQLLKASSFRGEAKCEHYSRCGGCHYQHVKPEYALLQKVEQIQDSLTRLGPGLTTLQPIVAPSQTWGYRNKLTFHRAGNGAQGYVAWDNYETLDIDHCPIAAKELDDLWRNLKKDLKDIPSSELPFVVLRKTKTQMAVILSTTHEISSKAFDKIKKAVHLSSSAISLWATRVKADSRTPFGEDLVHLSGEQNLLEEIGGVQYFLRPDLFFQIHPEIAERLVHDVVMWSKDQSSPILDLYCGAGLFSLAIAKGGQSVYGVEVHYPAILSAQESAKKNALSDRSEFRAGKAETILKRLIREGKRFETVIVDPPRKGLNKDVLEFLHQIGTKKLAYVSCSPPTMARDLKELVSIGYIIEKIQPYDMFPQTYHVETLTFLSRS